MLLRIIKIIDATNYFFVSELVKFLCVVSLLSLAYSPIKNAGILIRHFFISSANVIAISFRIGCGSRANHLTAIYQFPAHRQALAYRRLHAI